MVIARLRRNRILFQAPEPSQHKTRHRWYEQRFCLQNEATWPPVEEEAVVTHTSAKGRTVTQRLRHWANLRMRGTRHHPMHRFPFDLVQVQGLDDDLQSQRHPLWLLVWGQQRQQVSLAEVPQAYRQRFHLEHVLGFAQPHLLMDASQSCLTRHEINGVHLSSLAYIQLWLARGLATLMLLPWQRYERTNSNDKRTLAWSSEALVD